MLQLHTPIRVDVISVRRDILRAVNHLNAQNKPATIQQISKLVQCSEKTVYRHIGVLVTSDLVSLHRNRVNERKRVVYRITHQGKATLSTYV